MKQPHSTGEDSRSKESQFKELRPEHIKPDSLQEHASYYHQKISQRIQIGEALYDKGHVIYGKYQPAEHEEG